MLKFSGNEVYYTNALLCLRKVMLCSKLHCQKGVDLIRRVLVEKFRVEDGAVRHGRAPRPSQTPHPSGDTTPF